MSVCPNLSLLLTFSDFLVNNITSRLGPYFLTVGNSFSLATLLSPCVAAIRLLCLALFTILDFSPYFLICYISQLVCERETENNKERKSMVACSS
jgi:hypothetical protein